MARLTEHAKTLLEENMRDMMCKAVMELLRQKPLSEIKIAEVAAWLKVTPMTVYNYYPTRQILISETLRRSRENLYHNLCKGGGCAGAADNLLAFSRIIFSDFESYKYLFMARFTSPPLDEAGKSEAKSCFESIVNLFAEQIQNGIEEGIFRKVDPKISAVMMIGAISGVNRHCLFDWMTLPMEQRVEAFKVFMIDGLLLKKDLR